MSPELDSYSSFSFDNICPKNNGYGGPQKVKISLGFSIQKWNFLRQKRNFFEDSNFACLVRFQTVQIIVQF